MVYFFELVAAGEVKIGYSAGSVEERYSRAKTWCDVRVLLVLPEGTRKDEKSFHDLLEHVQVSTERFRLTPELRELLVAATEGFDWHGYVEHNYREKISRRASARKREQRKRESPEQRQSRLEYNRQYQSQLAVRRKQQSPDKRALRRSKSREWERSRYATEDGRKQKIAAVKRYQDKKRLQQMEQII